MVSAKPSEVSTEAATLRLAQFECLQNGWHRAAFRRRLCQICEFRLDDRQAVRERRYLGLHRRSVGQQHQRPINGGFNNVNLNARHTVHTSPTRTIIQATTSRRCGLRSR